MKRKYYIRGLGFGIVITALVFSFLDSSGQSDEEIIKRAKELGYVLATEVTPGIDLDELLASDTPKPTKAPQENLTPAPTEEPQETQMPEATNTPTPTLTEAPQVTEEPKETATPMPSPTETPIPSPTEIPAPSPAVIRAEINVVRGNSASQVCKMMEEAGIVSDWEKLREYLVENNLVDYINIGNFEVSSDMTFEEIAHILTGR